jgi:hypothetical protein
MMPFFVLFIIITRIAQHMQKSTMPANAHQGRLSMQPFLRLECPAHCESRPAQLQATRSATMIAFHTPVPDLFRMKIERVLLLLRARDFFSSFSWSLWRPLRLFCSSSSLYLSLWILYCMLDLRRALHRGTYQLLPTILTPLFSAMR